MAISTNIKKYVDDLIVILGQAISFLEFLLQIDLCGGIGHLYNFIYDWHGNSEGIQTTYACLSRERIKYIMWALGDENAIRV